MTTAIFDWSVWDLRKDGLIKKDGELLKLTSVDIEEGRGQEPVLMIRSAIDTPYFLAQWKECHSCTSGPSEDTMVITTEKHHIAPCYDCEVWSVWDNHTEGGMAYQDPPVTTLKSWLRDNR